MPPTPSKKHNKSYVLKDPEACCLEKRKKPWQTNYGIGMESRCMAGKKIR